MWRVDLRSRPTGELEDVNDTTVGGEKRKGVSDQNISIFDVEVEEEEEGDEEAQEGNGWAFPQTPHLVQGFPNQPHVVQPLTRICNQTKTKHHNTLALGQTYSR